jgi:hypothetical protein
MMDVMEEVVLPGIVKVVVERTVYGIIRWPIRLEVQG